MNIAIFCSGSGTNLQAIIDSCKSGHIPAKIVLVISDNKDAFALLRAKAAGIETVVIDPKAHNSREEFDMEAIAHLKRKEAGLIVLAGYMRLLSNHFVREYRNKIINVHPALLPSFKGTHGIKDALDYGVKVTGATVHFVDEKLDNGPIILQGAVTVNDDDTEETLLERVHKEEHRIFPEAIRLFVQGKIKVEGRKVRVA